jgi:hypothetical protein
VERAHEAYLEPWEAFGSRAELCRASALAVRLSMLSREFFYRRIQLVSWEALVTDDGEGVSGCFEDLRAASEL